ncbi:unnamed protein product [Discula destructiva]
MTSFFVSTRVLSSRLSPTPCRLVSSHFVRSLSRRSATRTDDASHTSLAPPSAPFQTPKSPPTPTPLNAKAPASITSLRISRKERDLHAIQKETGLVSEREKRLIAGKEAKRAKWAARMHKEHGDGWETVVAGLDRAKAHQRLNAGAPPVKKTKKRWTQQQKDEHAAFKAEKRAVRDARKTAGGAGSRARKPHSERLYKAAPRDALMDGIKKRIS